ncbi:PorT family protein [bacterium]|nr:PorT family protein [bacterium]
MTKPVSIFLSLTVIVFFPGRMHAQTGLGMSVGMNAASLTVSDPSLQHFSPRAGFNAGVCFTKPLSRSLAVQLGISLSQYGGFYREETNQPDFKTSEEVTIRGNYLFFPLSVRYYVEVRQGIMGYALVGAYGASRLGGYATGEIRGDYSLDIDVDLNDHAVPNDFGMMIGAGVRLPAGNRILFFEIALAKGLPNLYRPGDYLRVRDLSVHSSVLMITAGTDNLAVLPW